MSRIVAVVSHPGTVDALADLAEEHDLAIVGPRPARTGVMQVTHPVDLGTRSPLSAAIVRVAWRSAAGRNLIRTSPLDQSRRLWRATRSDRAVRELITGADVVVAADRDAVFTVWKMTRSRRFGQGWAAVFGASAARYIAASRSV